MSTCWVLISKAPFLFEWRSALSRISLLLEINIMQETRLQSSHQASDTELLSTWSLEEFFVYNWKLSIFSTIAPIRAILHTTTAAQNLSLSFNPNFHRFLDKPNTRAASGLTCKEGSSTDEQQTLTKHKNPNSRAALQQMMLSFPAPVFSSSFFSVKTQNNS